MTKSVRAVSKDSPSKGLRPSRAAASRLGGVVKKKLPGRTRDSLTFCTEPWLSSTVGRMSPPLASFSISASCTIIT